MIRVVGSMAVIVTAVSLAACSSEQAHLNTPSSGPDSPVSEINPPVTTPLVATFGGYDPIKTGMTVAEVLAIPGWTEGHDREHDDETCAMNTALGAEVSFGGGAPYSVTGIRTPKGTLTDRGVGNESTLEQIRSAYAGPGIFVSDLITDASGTTAFVMDPQERQISFDFDPLHGPAVEGHSGKLSCLPGLSSR